MNYVPKPSKGATFINTSTLYYTDRLVLSLAGYKFIYHNLLLSMIGKLDL